VSTSKSWTIDPENIQAVLELASTHSQKEIARKLGTTAHNVLGVLKNSLTWEERRAIGSLSHSRSKTGSKNPMSGKILQAHHGWKGMIHGKGGYLTILTPEGRIPYHRYVVQNIEEFHIHHIDGNMANNHPDNLAIVTPKGHKALHVLQKNDPKWLQLKKLKLVELTKSMTSVSKKMKVT
jgi:hypothetical protein